MKFPQSYSFISDEVSQELPVLRQFVREFKLPGIELRSFGGRAFKDLTPADVSAIGAASKEDGWRVFGCATPVFKCAISDQAAIKEHREIFRRSVEAARELGSDLVRIFTFLRESNPLEPKRLEQIKDELRGLADLAKGSGVRIGLENEHSCMTATVEEMQAVLDGLPADQFGAIWDPCNVLYVPGAALPVADNIKQLSSRLFHVHVKDAIQRPPVDSSYIAVGMPVGLGDVNWRAHLQALKDVGYKGILSLETHWRLEKIDEKMLHLPAGHAFSHGGEVASRTCLHNLKALADLL